MSELSLFSWLTKRRSNLTPKIQVSFQCQACDKKFKRKLRRLYIDLNTYDQRQLGESRPKRSEFIAPERIICPRCKAIDRYRFAPSIYQYIAQTSLMAANGMANPHQPIQCIRFTTLDGTVMHPLDALSYYATQLQDHPNDLNLRAAYANTLRMLGYLAQAEAQYRLILEQDDMEPQALLNLAVFHGQREEKDEAIHYLLRLVESETTGSHPDYELYADAAQQICDGVIRMDEIEMTAPAIFAVER